MVENKQEEETFLFTSESVNEGHPDKLADQISDAVLDACLEQDPNAKVACETACKNDTIIIFGEITTTAKLNYEQIVKDAVKEVGYDDEKKGLDYKTMSILNLLHKQSPDIAQGVHVNKKDEDIGAGDQGHMFGYATDETEEMMPLTHMLATKLGSKLTEVRKNGKCSWVRPDGKTQVVVQYKEVNGRMIPLRVHTIVISTQHDDDISNEKIESDLMKYVVEPVVPKKYLDEDTIYHLNPSGRFVIGGPFGDAGLTGRKIIIDTYGGWGAHGGGAFSGKDPTKVDRSGAYMARWIAKSLVAAKLCGRCLVQVSYAIGVAKPLSVHIDTYGSSKKSTKELLKIIDDNFDLRPGMIMKELDLKRPIYFKSAAYGHFGRDEKDFTWETPKELKL